MGVMKSEVSTSLPSQGDPRLCVFMPSCSLDSVEQNPPGQMLSLPYSGTCGPSHPLPWDTVNTISPSCSHTGSLCTYRGDFTPGGALCSGTTCMLLSSMLVTVFGAPDHRHHFTPPSPKSPPKKANLRCSFLSPLSALGNEDH